MRATPFRPGFPSRRAARLALLACLVCRPAHGEEGPPAPPAEPEAMAERLEAALAARDKRGAEVLLGAAAERHARCKSPAVRKRIEQAMAAVLGEEEMGGTRLHAADALGRLDDRRVAWEALRRHLPDAKDRAVGPLGLRVLRALGYMAHEPSMDPLLRFAERSEDPQAVEAAVDALAEFRFAKHRERLLVSLVDLGRGLPSRARPGKHEDAAQVRLAWSRAADRLVQALGRFAGRHASDLDGWRKVLDEHRGRLGELFESLPR